MPGGRVWLINFTASSFFFVMLSRAGAASAQVESGGHISTIELNALFNGGTAASLACRPSALQILAFRACSSVGLLTSAAEERVFGMRGEACRACSFGTVASEIVEQSSVEYSASFL